MEAHYIDFITLWHSQKTFWNLIISNRNHIVFTLFRLIWIQTDVCLVPNQTENIKYNLFSGWFDKISKRFLCVNTCSLLSIESGDWMLRCFSSCIQFISFQSGDRIIRVFYTCFSACNWKCHSIWRQNITSFSWYPDKIPPKKCLWMSLSANLFWLESSILMWAKRATNRNNAAKEKRSYGTKKIKF